MSAPAKEFEGRSEQILSNAAIHHGTGQSPSFREPIPSTSTATVTPSLQSPALPPRPNFAVPPSYGYGNGYSYGGMNGLTGSYGMGGIGGGYGSYGYGGMGGYGIGGMGGYNSYGGYNNRMGPMYGDIESRFIQMAEENSRPTFDSIQSVVSAFGSIAMMLENTFLALTSSFRAILGVAENFGRLRSLFAQFWSTFAVIRSLNWIVRKLMVILGIRTENEFRAWTEAVAATQAGSATPEQRARSSGWPVLLFFGAIMAAPYIVLRMLNGLTNSINERLNDPSTWQNPLRAVAQHAFQATSAQEITLAPNQVVSIAPQHLQGTFWNSGWLMASVDGTHAGLVPVNYIKIILPTNQIQNVTQTNVDVTSGEGAKISQPSVEELEKCYNELRNN